MTARKTKEWLELAALVAVLGGLLLVAYEIRQANIFAKAETENSIYAGWETLSMAVIETGINTVIAKALEDPSSLTTAERFDLSAHEDQIREKRPGAGFLPELDSVSFREHS